jgi:hypothetical protein
MFALLALLAAASVAPITDVQVGDDGSTARVVVVCADACAAEPLGEQSFFIRQGRADFSADTTGQSAHVVSIRMNSERHGSVLTVETRAPARAVAADRCGPMRLCFDFEFAAPAAHDGAGRMVSFDGVSADLGRLLEKAQISGAEAPALTCRQAEEALAADAFNLNAYRKVTACRAASGDEPAGRFLSRLGQMSRDTGTEVAFAQHALR